MYLVKKKKNTNTEYANKYLKKMFKDTSEYAYTVITCFYLNRTGYKYNIKYLWNKNK